MLNHGNMSGADAIFAPDIQFHYPLGTLSGANTVKDYLAAFRTLAIRTTHFPHALSNAGY
jgi:hypothetical protein